MTTRRRTIIRAAHNEQPYFMMLRSVAQNVALSYEALGLLAYLLSKPNDWEVYPDTLKRKHTGRASVYKLLKELREAGHVQRVVLRDDKKKIARFEYVIYEYPLPEGERDLLLKKQEVALQEAGKQDVGNQHNTEYRLSESKEEREDAPLTASEDELPDHVPPNLRRIAKGEEPQPTAPDGNTTSYQIVEQYCNAWSINADRYRKAIHRDQKRYADALAAMGATPEDVFAMCQAKRNAGKQPDEYGMRLVQLDWPGWKSRQESAPQLTVIKLTPEQIAADEARRKADQLQWWKENGLA